MKNNYVTNALCMALLLFSSMAAAETKYPAADFQPKVIYQDEGYQHSQPSATAAGSQAKSATVDPKYPAANFQPKVLYKDTGYKHQQPAKTTGRSTPSVSSAAVSSESAAAPEKAEESSSTFLIGILILAVVGYVLFNQGAKGKAAPKRAAPPRRAAASRTAAAVDSAATGVARYLAAKQGATTGVAKYLESLQKEAPTGVAKYMAKKVVSARKAAAEKVTGVEKYLRERG